LRLGAASSDYPDMCAMNAKALVLSALAVDAEHGEATLAALERALAARGYEVETVDCRTIDVIPCTGCSNCGLKTPGLCSVKDDMQEIFRKMVASDVLVLATPVRFGSYCAELKKVVDRFQPLMVPIYVVRGGEMHFRGRYDLPALVGVGLVRDGAAAAEEADAFRFLVGRLAVNIDTRHAAAGFAGGDQAAARAEIERALSAVEERPS
jgi:NAD(P)H-dependent FMN reductase